MNKYLGAIGATDRARPSPSGGTNKYLQAVTAKEEPVQEAPPQSQAPVQKDTPKGAAPGPQKKVIEPKRTGIGGFADKIGSGLGVAADWLFEFEKKAGEDIGGILATKTDDYDAMLDSQVNLDVADSRLLSQIAKNAKEGKDTTRLINQFNRNNEGRREAGEIIPVLDKSNLQVVADFAGVGLDIVTTGSLANIGTKKMGAEQSFKLLKNEPTKLSTKALVKEGGAIGGAFGLTGSLQEKDPSVLKSGISTAAGAGLGMALPFLGSKASEGISKLTNKYLSRIGKETSQEAGEAAEKKLSSKFAKPRVSDDLAETTERLTLENYNKPNKYISELETGRYGANRSKIKPAKLADDIPLTGNKYKESSFAKNISASKQTAKETSELLQESAQKYKVESNPATVKKARERIAREGTEKAAAFVRTAEEPTAEVVGTGVELIKNYQKEKKYDMAADMADAVSTKLTKAGQAIQAAKIYENLSPEAVLLRAQQFVKQENKKKILFARKNVLSTDDAELLYKTAKDMQQLSGDAKTEMAAELQGILGKYRRTGLGEKVSSIQTQAQLLNPKTTLVRNPLGNEIMYRFERLSKIIALPIDIARSKVTGAERSIVFKKGNQEKYWKNWLKGAKSGWKGTNLGPNTQYDLKNHTFKNKLNPFYWGEKTVGAALKSFDYAAYKRAYGETLYEVAFLKAKKEGFKGTKLKEQTFKYLDKLDSRSHALANEYGKYVTFQDDNVISKVASQTKKLLNVNQKFGLGDLVLKYPKVPGALLSRALEYSPIGFARSMKLIAEPILFKKPATQAANREIAMATSRAIVGTLGFTGFGYYLADKGIITGAPPENRNVAGVQEEQGKGGYMINLSALKRLVLSGFTNATTKDNDVLMSYDWAEPASVSLSIGANLSTGDKFGAAESFTNTVDTISEQPLFSGVLNTFKYGVQEGVSNVAEGAGASFTPTLLNQFRQFTDNTKRQTRGDTFGEGFSNRVKNRIPGVAGELPPQVGSFGESKTTFDDNNIFNVFLNPGNVTRFKEIPEAELVLNLMEERGETDGVPRAVDKKATLFGERVTIPTDEQAAMQQYAGKRVFEMLNRAVNSEKFNNFTPDQKAKALESNLRDIGTNVRVLLMAKRAHEAVAQNDTEALEWMKENVSPADVPQFKAAYEYLKTEDPFEIEEIEEKEPDKEKSSTLPMMLAGLGVAAASRGKKTKPLVEAITKKGSKTATKVLNKEKTKILDKPINSLIKVFRQHDDFNIKTDLSRGGTWYQTKGSKNYSFADDAMTGGKKMTETDVKLKKPLVIDDAIVEDGSFSVINSGYENELPQTQRKLADKLYDAGDDITSTSKYDKKVRQILTENGNTPTEIDAVLANKNKGDVAMDLVVSKGLKESGYDSLVLNNRNSKISDDVLDQHVFKFPEQADDIGEKEIRNAYSKYFNLNDYEGDPTKELTEALTKNPKAAANSISKIPKSSIREYPEGKFVEVYRGGEGEGVSWTLDKEVAQQFADGGEIMTREEPLKNVAYYAGGSENEIIFKGDLPDPVSSKLSKEATKQRVKNVNKFEKEGVGELSSKLLQRGPNNAPLDRKKVDSMIKWTDKLPVVVTSDGTILDGQHRFAAARKTNDSLKFVNQETYKLPKLTIKRRAMEAGHFIKDGYEWSFAFHGDIPPEAYKKPNKYAEIYRKELAKDSIATPKFTFKPLRKIVDDKDKLTFYVGGKKIKAIEREPNVRFSEMDEDEMIVSKPFKKMRKGDAVLITGTENVMDESNELYYVLSKKKKGFVAVNALHYGDVTDEYFDIDIGEALTNDKIDKVFFPINKRSPRSKASSEKILIENFTTKITNEERADVSSKISKLLAMHSTDSDGLRSILKEKKIWGPSVAIFDKSKVEKDFGFGDYHMIMKKETIDPSKKDVYMFTDDVFTPRIKTDEASVKAMSELARKDPNFLKGGEFTDKELPVVVSVAKRIKSFKELEKASAKFGTKKESFDTYMNFTTSINKAFRSLVPNEIKSTGMDLTPIAEHFAHSVFKAQEKGSLTDPKFVRSFFKRVYETNITDVQARNFTRELVAASNQYKVLYLEAKILRGVGLHEVDSILIPRGTPDDIIKLIDEAGIKRIFYNVSADGKNVHLKPAFNKAAPAALGVGILPFFGNSLKEKKETLAALKQELEKLRDTNDELKTKVEQRKKTLEAKKSAKKGKITVYNPDPRQTDDTPNKGGFMTEMEFGDVAVANRDEYFDAKDKFQDEGKDTFIVIPELEHITTPHGKGVFRVRDTMNKRYDGSNRIDVFLPYEKKEENKAIRNTPTGSYYYN